MRKSNSVMERVARVKSIAQAKGLIATRQAQGEAASAASQETSPKDERKKPVQLKFWNERVRCLPNPIARSALFTVSNKPRRVMKNNLIVSSAGFELLYTGEELRQSDEDVFLQIVHLSRIRPLGDVIEISGYQLLKSLGWSYDSRSYKRLRESIERLKTGNVKIEFSVQGKAGYFGSMIRKVAWAGETAGSTKWRIYLEPEIINLFDSDGYSLLPWERRLGLRDLAKWLLSFYYTHEEPLPYKVTTIYEMCGSGAKSINHFRAELKASLEDLKSTKFLTSWEITAGDLVQVVRNKNDPLRILPRNPQAAEAA